MAIMVEEQDPGIQAVEAKAQEAETDMHQACAFSDLLLLLLRLLSRLTSSSLAHSEGQMQKAVKSARAARKKRWICFGIVVVIRESCFRTVPGKCANSLCLRFRSHHHCHCARSVL